MNFNQLSYLPWIIALFAAFVLLVIMMERRFFKFIQRYWFYRRSFFSYLATFFFIIGIAGLFVSLLDPRGPEEKIKTQLPGDRTIILIDTSASMLAEDVKPSRLQKATLIAKHFARKSVGHQISIVAFAEIQKKIVPFTTDLDLIDARLDSIKNLRNHYGSSALSLAIQESIQYFREISSEARGNILILTDGEETAEGISFNVPKDVHVALVGIGTSRGGRIPLDDDRGFRLGYKKDRGQDVITKLNENFFKKATSDIPSGKYWLTNSYSLPTEEILDFFRGEKIKGFEQQDMVIKPVLMEWIVIPSILLLFLSYIFKSIRIFTLGILLFISPTRAEDNQKELSPEIIANLNDLKKGNLGQVEKLKLADDLYKSGAKDDALALYCENLPEKINKNIPPEAYMNFGTALLEKGDTKRALNIYQKLVDQLDSSPSSQKLKEMMEKNVTSSFLREEQKNKEEKNKEDQKENKDQKENQSGKGNQDNKKTGKPDQKDKAQEKDNKDQEKKQNKEDKDENADDKKNKESDRENDLKKKLPPQKIPAKLKQLMSDDRQLQMKMIENGTRDLNRKKSNKSKDW